MSLTPTMQQWVTAQQNPETVVNENFVSLQHIAVYGMNPDTTTGLTWGYLGGRWAGFAVTAGTLTLTASQTNYVVVARSTGVISTSTTNTNWNNTTNYARVFLITTGVSTVTAVEDHRAGTNGIFAGTAQTAVALSGLSDVNIPSPNDGDVLTYDTGTSKWVAEAPTGGTASAIIENPIINGGFEINQRAAASIADDTYGHDRWYALTQTGAIAPSTVTNAEDGTPYMARLTQSQASAQRFGYAQIIESVNCINLRGKQVTFRFNRVRLSASSNIRYAVLEWTGTADTVTSDVVNDWTSSTYTAGNFFLASNLTVSGVVQQAVTANTLTDGSSVTVTLGSSFNNLIVFAWTESIQAQNVTLDLSKAQIDLGATALDFRHRSYSNEFTRCARYYYRMTSSAANDPYAVGGLSSTTASQYYFPFPTQMRIAPTGVETSTASNFNVATTTALTVSAITSIPMTRFVGGVAVTHSAGTAGNFGRLRAGSGDYIGFTGSEL